MRLFQLTSAYLDDRQHFKAPTVPPKKGIEKVRELVGKGEKVGIILGRDNSEYQLKEKEIHWFTLDVRCDKDLENTYHIQGNFNDKQTIEELSNLFSKVVVDRQVAHFMEDPWHIVYNLVAEQGEAIIEANFRLSHLNEISDVIYEPEKFQVVTPFFRLYDEVEENIKIFDAWKNQAGEEKYNELLQNYLKVKDFSNISHWPAEDIEYEKIRSFRQWIIEENNLQSNSAEKILNGFLEAVEQHSEFYFSEIETKYGPYPYRCPQNDEPPIHYFILRKPNKSF